MTQMLQVSDFAFTKNNVGKTLAVSRAVTESVTVKAAASHGFVRGNSFRTFKSRSAAPKELDKPKFSVIPAGSFAAGSLPGWFIKDVLPKAELAVLYGESSAGKSFLLLDMVFSVARGEKWCGRTVKQGRVVYVCGEGKAGFRKRLRAYAQHHNVDLDNIPLGVIENAPNLLMQDDQAVAEQVKAWGGADIIVFDTLAQCTPGANENGSESIGKALGHCKRLHRVTGALIILVAHTGKDPSRGVRGWSGIKGATDVQIEVVRSGDYRALKIDKQKDERDGDEFGFQLCTVNVGQDEDGNDVTSCVIEYTEKIPRAERKSEPRNVKQKLVLNMARKLLKFDRGPVPVNELIETCIAEIPKSEQGKCDNRRRDLARALDALTVSGLIDTDNGYVNLK
jgi:hypothetical protein